MIVRQIKDDREPSRFWISQLAKAETISVQAAYLYGRRSVFAPHAYEEVDYLFRGPKGDDTSRQEYLYGFNDFHLVYVDFLASTQAFHFVRG